MVKADLPPGFRFHPTDEELIVYYLKNQATSKPCPISIIPEIDIYKFDPWELPEKTEFGENEWYFFSPRDRKYPKGVRPNRTAASGYWKATGTDKAIHSDSKYVGVKKALVFYKGKPPNGVKTNWIMHEYRLVESTVHPKAPIDSMRLDDWVLCRIYKKKDGACKTIEECKEETPPQMKLSEWSEDQKMKFQRNHLLYDNVYPSSHDLQNPTMELEQDQFSYPNSYDNHLFNPTFLFNSSYNGSKFSI